MIVFTCYLYFLGGLLFYSCCSNVQEQKKLIQGDIEPDHTPYSGLTGLMVMLWPITVPISLMLYLRNERAKAAVGKD